MKKPTKTHVVRGEHYEKYHPGTVVASSKEEAWEGLLFNQYTHPILCHGTPRPATDDHIIAFGCSGAVSGENAVNSNKWQPYEWQPHEFFIGPAFANDRDSRWQALSGDDVELRVGYIHLAPELLHKNAENIVGGNGSKIELPYKLGFKDPFMLALGMQLRKELGGQSVFGKLYVDTIANMLAVHLLRHHCVFTHEIEKDPVASRNTAAIQRVRDYIHDNLRQELRLEELATVANMSSFHFSRLFKKTTGMPPHQYVVAERIKRAKHLLRHSTFSISHIAAELGYSPAHFGLVFRRVTKMTPSLYRSKV